MTPICPNCYEPVEMRDVFCGSCGKKITSRKAEKERSSLRLVIIFYVVYLLYSIVSYILYEQSDALATELALESVFVLITVLFSLYDFRRVIALYNFRNIDLKGWLFSLIFPVFSAVLVYFGIAFLNELLMEGDMNPFYEYSYYPNGVFWVFFFFTILPPIFEELAFRGFLFNQLLEISNWRVTVFATAFVFALVHFSWISFIWIFPFGVVLGYLRYRYNTLWLGMLVHFIHNFLVTLIDFYYYNLDEFNLMEF